MANQLVTGEPQRELGSCHAFHLRLLLTGMVGVVPLPTPYATRASVAIQCQKYTEGSLRKGLRDSSVAEPKPKELVAGAPHCP